MWWSKRNVGVNILRCVDIDNMQHAWSMQSSLWVGRVRHCSFFVRVRLQLIFAGHGIRSSTEVYCDLMSHMICETYGCGNPQRHYTSVYWYLQHGVCRSPSELYIVGIVCVALGLLRLTFARISNPVYCDIVVTWRVRHLGPHPAFACNMIHEVGGRVDSKIQILNEFITNL